MTTNALRAAAVKITVVGSEVDTSYFSDISPWKMSDEVIEVVEDNEHLGQIVSGKSQEQKNVDLRISKARNCLFGLLGASFAFKCFLSPVLKLHIFRTYISPIMCSGLSSFALQNTQLEPLELFERKLLKSILKLSSTAPTTAIHFLTGELPVEGKIHKDVFSNFYSIWNNPDTKIHELIKYLLRTSSDNSRTWAILLRHLCNRYGLEDPLVYMNGDPPAQSAWKELVNTKITAYHEQKLRAAAAKNRRMNFLNTYSCNLKGRHHPALSNMVTTWDVKRSRAHIKFLSYEVKAEQGGGSPLCKICQTGSVERISHIIASCPAMAKERDKVLLELRNLCTLTKNNLSLDYFIHNEDVLSQFILDPTSLNLSIRVSLQDPIVSAFYRLSRDICFILGKTRLKLLDEFSGKK